MYGPFLIQVFQPRGDQFAQHIQIDIGQFIYIKAGLADLMLAQILQDVGKICVAGHDIQTEIRLARAEPCRQKVALASTGIGKMIPTETDDARAPHTGRKPRNLLKNIIEHESIRASPLWLDHSEKGRNVGISGLGFVLGHKKSFRQSSPQDCPKLSGLLIFLMQEEQAKSAIVRKIVAMEDAFHASPGVTLDEALGWFDIPVFVIEVTGNPSHPYVMCAINPAYERVTGTTAIDVVGRSIDDSLPPRLAATVKRNYDRCVTCKDTVTYEELLGFEGTEKWWFTTLNPQISDDGRVHRIVGLTQDLTIQKTESMALATEMAELSALNSELRTLTAMAAHDLRGPLGTLESLLELQLEDFIDVGDGKTELLTASLDVITTLRPQIEALLVQAMSLDPKTTRL